MFSDASRLFVRAVLEINWGNGFPFLHRGKLPSPPFFGVKRARDVTFE